MAFDGIGSSVIIALAALLWLCYLVPTWLRRREYLSTERNALRLQQTLRVMAETAELPAAVRAESTARGVAQQAKVLRRQLQHEAAVAKAQDASTARAAARQLAATRQLIDTRQLAASRQLAELRPVLAADVAVTSSAARRLRRSRLVTTLLLVASFVAAGFGVGQLLAAGTWLLLGGAAVVAVGSFAMLGQMAAVGRARGALATELRAQPSVAVRRQQVAQQPAVQREWTPVPVPKPLYLSGPQVARAVAASLESAAELRQAAADSERALREAQREPEVTPFRRTAAAPAVASRFASMGIVGETEAGMTDLDAVLRRRRAAG
ncbi:MAG: hypothetical protein JWO10_1939 [Microbacteriaceae bacterium]|nr:hypothetical protein [Microbacteriaceae bacterium]